MCPLLTHTTTYFQYNHQAEDARRRDSSLRSKATPCLTRYTATSVTACALSFTNATTPLLNDRESSSNHTLFCCIFSTLSEISISAL